MLTPNEKIQRAFYSIQKKLNNNNIKTLGATANTFLIDLVKDKYSNKGYTIKDYSPFAVYVQFPGEEIPTPNMGNNDNQTSNNVLHLYDVLPIIARCSFDFPVKTGNVFLYKVKQPDDTYFTMVLEFISVISKATRVGVVSQEWIVAPITDYALYNLPEFTAILEQYKKLDLW